MVIQVLEDGVHHFYFIVVVDVVLCWVIVEVKVVPTVQLLLKGVDYRHQIFGAWFQVLLRNVVEVRQWLLNEFVFNDGATNVDFRELAVVYQNVGTISLGFEHRVHRIEEVSNDHVVQLQVVVLVGSVCSPVFAVDKVKQRV